MRTNDIEASALRHAYETGSLRNDRRIVHLYLSLNGLGETSRSLRGMSPLRFGRGLDRQSRPTNRRERKESERFKSFAYEELIKRD